MDGRVQLPVIKYLQKRFNAEYVDSITEPGPNLILSEGIWNTATRSILNRLEISIEKHESVGVAIVGHYDCAGNPASKDVQLEHTKHATAFVKQQCPKSEVIGLWVDEKWNVSELT